MNKLAFLIAIMLVSTFSFGQSRQVDSLQALLSSTKTDTARGRLLFHIATHWSRINPDSASPYVVQSATIFNTENYTKGKADIELLQARICVNKNETAQALQHYKKALSFYEIINDEDGQAAVYSGMGVAYGMQEKFVLSLTNIIKALKLYEKNNNLKGVANSFMKIGVVHTRSNDLPAALSNFQKALAIAEQTGDITNQASIHVNMGSLYGQMQILDKSLQSLKKGKTLAKQAKLLPIGADANMNIGNAFREFKKYDSAAYYFTLAEADFKQLQNNESLARTYLSMAELFFLVKKYDEAKTTIKRSIEIASNINNQSLLYENYDLLVKVSKAEKDYSAATIYYSQLLSLKDTIFNAQKNEQLQRLKIEYQHENDERLIQQLQEENELRTTQRNTLFFAIVVTTLLLILLAVSLWIIVQRNLQMKKRKAELTEMNLMKDRFLSVISHDLRSPLANILQLLHLISDDNENKEHKIIFDRLKLTTGSVLETMDNMLAWGKNYFSQGIADKKELSLTELTERVCRFLKQNADNKNIQIINYIQQDILITADENQLEFVLRNLVSNAIKFSHEKSSIELTASSVDHTVNIHVKDFGKGMREEQQQKLFDINKRESTKGTAGETGSGLVLFLSKEFINLHNGSLHLISAEGKGTEFIVSLPQN